VPNQTGGGLRIPFFLANHARIEDEASAERYVALVENAGPHLRQLAERVGEGARSGIALSPHAHAAALTTIDQMLASGAGLARDLAARLDRLGWIEAPRAARLRRATAKAVAQAFLPGLRALRDAVAVMRPPTGADGVWALPDGEAFYADALLDWTADQVDAAALHDEALDEVARLQDESARVGARIGYTASFRSMIADLRADPDANYTDDDAGRAACLARAQQLGNAIAERLPYLTSRRPQAVLDVLPVEPERTNSAIFGDYNAPLSPGERGRYYLNLSDMTKLPRHEIASLTFHEGLPGHHLQITLALENDGLMDFERRPFLFESFAEGWAMYAERLGFEIMGDELDDRDRLGLVLRRLWMAARVVADTGLHHKRWSRGRIIDYLLTNTGISPSLATSEADRYSVWPAQACAYYTGLRVFERLRAGSADATALHDRVLGRGGRPLWTLQGEAGAADELRAGGGGA